MSHFIRLTFSTIDENITKNVVRNDTKNVVRNDTKSGTDYATIGITDTNKLLFDCSLIFLQKCCVKIWNISKFVFTLRMKS